MYLVYFETSYIYEQREYHLTIFLAGKWLIKKIDKLTRGFLWNVEEEASGGKCLVN
jgi:hypothetical protein